MLANLNRPDYTGIKSQMHSIGLSNLRKRLNLMYPGRYLFRFNSAPNQRTCITIEVPIEHNERKENDETHNP